MEEDEDRPGLPPRARAESSEHRHPQDETHFQRPLRSLAFPALEARRELKQWSPDVLSETPIQEVCKQPKKIIHPGEFETAQTMIIGRIQNPQRLLQGYRSTTGEFGGGVDILKE